METEELDNALNELEVRLDRLRALYEQYFLGIEKLEPTIPRKDVDRRFYLLRREKIRNTGRRFKLQTLIQRYNTFQQYWQRICREIENGTYRRHVLRAERNAGPSELLTVASRRRFGRERARQAEAAQEAPAAAAPPAPSSELPAPSSVLPAPSSVLPAPRLETPTLPRGSRMAVLPPLPTPGLPRDLTAATAPLAAGTSQPTGASQETNARERERLPPSMRPAKSTPPSSYESLELDMDFMGDWDPEGRPAPAASGRASKGRPAPPPKPARRQQRSTHPGLAPPPPGTPGPRAPSTGQEAKSEGTPPAAPPPRATPPQATPPAAAPPQAPPPQATSAQATSPTAARAPEGAVARPAAAVARRPAAQPRAAAASSGAQATLPEDRVRALHDRFLEETKKTNHPAVSLEGLTKSLRAAEARLRAQHGNRRIDFEVIVKDGKPALKPIVR